MLDLQVVPERSIGTDQWEITLGMPLFQVVKVLKKEFPTIQRVEFNYNEIKPFDDDLVLKLPDDGLQFIFNAAHQRLNCIEAYDLTKLKLKYCGSCFNSPQIPPTPKQIDQVFGATQPSKLDTKLQMNYLAFRGLNFYFPIDQSSEMDTSTKKSFTKVKKMILYANKSIEEKSVPPEMPLSCYHSNFFSDNTHVIFTPNGVAEGISLNLTTVGTDKELRIKKEAMKKTIKFGDTVQDVLSEIGSPCQTFFKSEDKMIIHSSQTDKYRSLTHSDYFFNYITLGLDILFDGNNHVAKKFILHTNHPNHYNFNIYYRCNFNIVLSGKSSVITPLTSWKTVEDSLGGKENLDLPVLLNRSSSVNNTNPFGSTFCYGLYNMIFEVMKNGYIANVTLYASETLQQQK